LGRECYALNFRFYADQRNPYVYAQAPTDILNMAARMEQLARVSPQGHDLLIHVVTPEVYWPLPWYLRRFNGDRIGYWSDPAEWARTAAQGDPPAVIMLTADAQSAVDAHLRVAYNKQMIYGLRPGVLLLVYVREDCGRRPCHKEQVRVPLLYSPLSLGIVGWLEPPSSNDKQPPSG
jgi:predicted membrane-bound mannosyltransferase